jgi:hypothetical protein
MPVANNFTEFVKSAAGIFMPLQEDKPMRRPSPNYPSELSV